MRRGCLIEYTIYYVMVERPSLLPIGIMRTRLKSLAGRTHGIRVACSASPVLRATSPSDVIGQGRGPAARDRLKRGNFGAIEPYHVRTPAGWNNRN